MRIQVVQLNPVVGDVKGNAKKIIQAIKEAKGHFDLLLFSELVLTGYPPQDLLLQDHFMYQVEKSMEEILLQTEGISVVFGLPRRDEKKYLYISAAVISNGVLQSYYDKCLLPTYDVFNERRYFESGQGVKVFKLGDQRVAITICEDIWGEEAGGYIMDPVALLQSEKPDWLLNLSASPYSTQKWAQRLSVCQRAAKMLHCPVVLCNQVGGNDSLIFDGRSVHISTQGELLQVAAAFKEDKMAIAQGNAISFHFDPMEELFEALVLGLRDYMHKSGFKKACIGLSGGIDSALTAVIAVKALGSENVIGLMMPSRFSSVGSVADSEQLAQHLGIDVKNISIEKPFQAYLDILEPLFEGRPFDVTEENLQARIRGMLLMAFSNKFNYIVLSTGNKCEMAMGYSTLYGDLCGGVGVIGDLTKEQIYSLSYWVNREDEVIPQSIIDKAPSAELRLDQKDSDSLPSYAIIDQVIEGYVIEHLSAQEIAGKYSLDEELVRGLIKKIHQSEYKRRQAPPSFRVSEKAFSVGRHFPIVQGWVK